MSLPKIDTQEWKDELQFYTHASLEDRRKRADALSMPYASYSKRMRERGVYVATSETPSIDTPEVINLPPVKLREYKARKVRKGNEEVAVLLAADGHGGKITKSFNKDVYRTRMGNMFEAAMIIVNLHRNMYPINKLRIINLGDNTQGENRFQGSVVGAVEMGARDQTTKLACPIWNDILGSFKQQFAEVEFEGLPGNHGYEKGAPETSREDLRLYDLLSAGIGQQKGITINIHEDWYGIVDIMGYKVFCWHGDGTPSMQGIPLFAIDRRLKAWHMQFGGFDYAVCGHFHKRHMYEFANGKEHFMVSTLVSDDEWAQKKLGVSSEPSQWLIGVHPRHGVTWRYALNVVG